LQHADQVALLRAGVPTPGGVWADMGAGTGSFSLALAELLGPQATLYAVDRDARVMRDLAQTMAARFPGITLHTLTGDFTRPLSGAVPPLDGIVMANALHFVPDTGKEAVVRLMRAQLRPAGRLLLVEYNVDTGNQWVPYPLSFSRWQTLAHRAGFVTTRLLTTVPSRFLTEFYAAEATRA
jgi:precorrin-6B methylase 2